MHTRERYANPVRYPGEYDPDDPEPDIVTAAETFPPPRSLRRDLRSKAPIWSWTKPPEFLRMSEKERLNFALETYPDEVGFLDCRAAKPRLILRSRRNPDGECRFIDIQERRSPDFLAPPKPIRHLRRPPKPAVLPGHPYCLPPPRLQKRRVPTKTSSPPPSPPPPPPPPRPQKKDLPKTSLPPPPPPPRPQKKDSAKPPPPPPQAPSPPSSDVEIISVGGLPVEITRSDGTFYCHGCRSYKPIAKHSPMVCDNYPGCKRLFCDGCEEWFAEVSYGFGFDPLDGNRKMCLSCRGHCYCKRCKDQLYTGPLEKIPARRVTKKAAPAPKPPAPPKPADASN